jgi:hypothetical protein
MSLISSLPFCVEEFAHMDFAYDKYMVPYYNYYGGPDRTGFKGTLFPLALTKEQVHALYWKVVSIELDYQVEDSVGNATIGKAVSDAEVPEDLLGASVDTAIIKRVCGGLKYLPYTSEYESFNFITNELQYDYDIQYLSLFDDRFIFTGGVISLRIPRCLKIENNYYPFFEWGDNAYESEVTTFGVEKFSTSTNSQGGVSTLTTVYLNGPTITLSFPDSSTASFQVFLRRQTSVPPPPSPSKVFNSLFTHGPWNVNLW